MISRRGKRWEIISDDDFDVWSNRRELAIHFVVRQGASPPSVISSAEAIKRALEVDRLCGYADAGRLDARNVNGLTADLIEDHIRHHVVNPDRGPDAERARGAAELIDVVRTYLK